MAAGRFRQDLYYRINVVTIQMPSLVERIGDIPLLAANFLKKFRAEVKREILDFSPEALQALQAYHWPGNVRELENAIERAVVMCRDRHIGVEHLPGHVTSDAPKAKSGEGSSLGQFEYTPMPLKDALEEPEKRIIEAAL